MQEVSHMIYHCIVVLDLVLGLISLLEIIIVTKVCNLCDSGWRSLMWHKKEVGPTGCQSLWVLHVVLCLVQG